MMTSIWGPIAPFAIAVGACGASDRAENQCADISGNWSILSTDAGGSTCPPQPNAGQPVNIGIQRQADGSFDLVMPGLTGACPASFDATSCKLTANCGGKDASGNTIADYSIVWTFAGSKLSGSEIGKVSPPAVATACTDNSSDTGHRL